MKGFLAALVVGISLVTGLYAQEVRTLPGEHAAKNTIRLVVFLSVDCPISQKYIGVLNELVHQYGPQVSIQGIIPGSIPGKEVKQFKKEFQPEFPLEIDPAYRRTDDLKPAVTPEAFVFDRQGNLKYQGAIDNWFYDLGSYRQQTTENYLKDALDAVLKGAEPTLKKTDAIGCIIQKRVRK